MQKFILIFLMCFMASLAYAVPTQVYFNNFDTSANFSYGVTGSISGAGGVTGVQGFAGYGPSGNVFGGSFFRNMSTGNPAAATILTLNNLPTHYALDISFLLGIVDSWDGGGTAGPDYLYVKVDGVVIFAENIRSYANEANTRIMSPLHLGFNSIYVDNAYNMYLENALKNIAHTGNSVTIQWYAGGAGWQGDVDESWALENLQISVHVPEPATSLFMMLGIVAAYFGWRKSR